MLICRFDIFRTHKRCIYGFVETTPTGSNEFKIQCNFRSWNLADWFLTLRLITNQQICAVLKYAKTCPSTTDIIYKRRKKVNCITLWDNLNLCVKAKIVLNIFLNILHLSHSTCLIGREEIKIRKWEIFEKKSVADSGNKIYTANVTWENTQTRWKNVIHTSSYCIYD